MDSCFVCDRNTLKKCKKCDTNYCSVKCQSKDWSQHKKICFKINPYGDETFETDQIIITKFDNTSKTLLLWGESHVIKRLQKANNPDLLQSYRKSIKEYKNDRIIKITALLELTPDLEPLTVVYDNIMGMLLTPQLSIQQYKDFESFLKKLVRDFIYKINNNVFTSMEQLVDKLSGLIYNDAKNEDDWDLIWELRHLTSIALSTDDSLFLQKTDNLIKKIQKRVDSDISLKSMYHDIFIIQKAIQEQYILRHSFIKNVFNYMIKKDLISVWGDFLSLFYIVIKAPYSTPLMPLEDLEKMMWDLNEAALLSTQNIKHMYNEKVGDDISPFVTLKKDTVLYRAFGNVSFDESWGKSNILWFSFNLLKSGDYISMADTDTMLGNSFDPSTKWKRRDELLLSHYVDFLGHMVAVKTKKDLIFPNIKNINTVKQIIKEIKKENDPELLSAFSSTVIINNDNIERKSEFEKDDVWTKFLCKKGYNGYIASSFSAFNEEVAICDYTDKIDIVRTYKPTELGIHFTNPIYQRYPVKMFGNNTLTRNIITTAREVAVKSHKARHGTDLKY